MATFVRWVAMAKNRMTGKFMTLKNAEGDCVFFDSRKEVEDFVRDQNLDRNPNVQIMSACLDNKDEDILPIEPLRVLTTSSPSTVISLHTRDAL